MELSASFQKELQRQKNRGGDARLDISWAQGLEMMYLRNPQLIQADHRVEDARQRQKQLFRDMVPSVILGASDNFFIGDLSEAFNDPSYRINSFLSLGNLLTLPKDLYTRKLFYLGAEFQAENTMRQQVIGLYRLFQLQKLLRIEKRALDLEGELLRSVQGQTGAEALNARLEFERSVESWERREETWRQAVGDFFMTTYDKIELQRRGLPEISYRISELDFSRSERWGMLQLNLLALEQIAEQGQILDTYFRYLPRANLSVSAPPLFNNNSNSSFEFERIRLSPSLNWNLDTRGVIGNQLNRIRREMPLKDWRQDRRQRQEVRRLLEGKDTLVEIQTELRQLRSATDGYREAVRAGLVPDFRNAIQTMRGLREQEIQLAAREIEIYTEFWLIDDSRWAPLTKRWRETRPERNKVRVKEAKKGFFYWLRK